jgi:hypothetical protein
VGAIKSCLPENARWDDDVLVLEEPVDDDTLEFFADQISFEDWGADR